jgi:arylsulfatase
MMQDMNASSQRPNIILVTTDQQRGDCLGVDENAPECLQTPHLDELACQGARFRRGYSECPSCLPARRTLMSGMAPAAHGMVGMRGSAWNPPHTLAGELAKAGYHTFLVGKLHLQPRGKLFGFNHQLLSDAPYDVNDEYYRWLSRTHGMTDYWPGLGHGQDPNGWDARPTHLREDQTHSYWCVSQAIEFLQYQRDPTQPFFLNVSLFDPHPPIVPPAFYYERYINRETPPPVIGNWAVNDAPPRRKGMSTSSPRVHLTEQQMHCTRAGYYASINFVDDQVGRLMRYIIRNGLSDNTWILFTSDHGEMLGDHYRYRKCLAYEGSARVPFFITPPKKAGLANNVVSDEPVGLQDVMPTLLDIAGAPIPEACTGRSLLPVLRGDSTPIRSVLHGEHAGQYDYADGHHFLIDKRYKYIWYSQRQCEHLFDLQEDPNELRDLALEGDAETRLAPYRQAMVEILRSRPEGFVKNDTLTIGAPHHCHIPDLQGDRFYPYL